MRPSLHGDSLARSALVQGLRFGQERAPPDRHACKAWRAAARAPVAAYTDVAAANVNPLDHYDQFGWHEGRDPSVDFDTTAYLAAYPDVAAAGTNPLTHFLQFGDDESRSPFSDGVWN